MTRKRLEVFRLIVYVLASVWIGYLAPNLFITCVGLGVVVLGDLVAYRLLVQR